MPNGGLIQVRSEQDPVKDGILLSFMNNGPSIQPEILSNIFDPFVTTKEGGTGLGLAITYDIVQRHQGWIEVESQPTRRNDI